MIMQKLLATCREYADREAIVFQNHRISYQQLNHIISRLANGLHEIGIEKGDRVAVVLPNVPHFVFSYYAIMKIGAQAVPINYLMELDDLNSSLKTVRPKAIIFWDRFRSLISGFLSQDSGECLRIVLGKRKSNNEFSLTHLIASSEYKELEKDVTDEDAALVQFTSGITDAPKPAVFSHRAIEKSCHGICEFFRFDEEESFLAVLPLVMSVSQNGVMNAALLNGGKLVLLPKVDVESILELISVEAVTSIVGTPKLFSKVAASDGLKSNQLKYCISVNNFLTEEVRKEFEDKFNVPLLNSYAVTEAGGLVASMHPSTFSPEKSVGMTLPHAEILLFNEENEMLPVGEEGELSIKSESLFSGYFENEDLTQEKLKDGWFLTGDIGSKDEDGIIYIKERQSNIILKSGFKIQASEIEKALCSHPKVKEAAVIGVPHPSFKEDLKAFVVTNENSVTQEDLIEYCKQKFPMYMIPARIEFRNQLPRTRMGRISKRKLKSEVWI